MWITFRIINGQQFLKIIKFIILYKLKKNNNDFSYGSNIRQIINKLCLPAKFKLAKISVKYILFTDISNDDRYISHSKMF